VGLLAVEWKGNFMTGHAQILKAMIDRLHTPLLLIRQRIPEEAILKVGERLAG
jgi:hypothetical protein